MKTRHIIPCLLAIQLAFILLLRADFLTDWDSYLYTYGALTAHPIPLAAGRWPMTAILGLVWQIVNLFTTVSPDSAWKIFSLTTSAFALLNAVLFFLLAKKWFDRDHAVIASALFVSSPLIALYGSAVMTETYALTALLGTLLLLSAEPDKLWRIALAGAVFAIGCSIREPLILLAPLPLGLIAVRDQSRLRVLAQIAVFAFAVAFVLCLNFIIVWCCAPNWPEIYKSWSAGMARERLQLARSLWKMGLRNLIAFACWLAIFSPIVVILIPEMIRSLRRHRPHWAFPLFAAVTLYTFGQIANHSLIFNPRFVLFIGALLCMPVAAGLRGKLPAKMQNSLAIGSAVILLHLAIIGLFWSTIQSYYFDRARAARETCETLRHAPDSALFIPGRLTPVVEFYKNLHQKNQWQIIYAGWDFSDKELSQAIENARNIHRPVFIVEPDFWSEQRYRPDQYSAAESVWDRYIHHPSAIAHFAKLEFSTNRTPAELFRKILNFLFS